MIDLKIATEEVLAILSTVTIGYMVYLMYRDERGRKLMSRSHSPELGQLAAGFLLVVHSCAANYEPACLFTYLLTMTTTLKFPSLAVDDLVRRGREEAVQVVGGDEGDVAAAGDRRHVLHEDQGWGGNL